MTREEAIHRIENHIRIHSKQEPFRACHIQEALKMAIDALKAQEPVEPTWRRGLAFCSSCGRQFCHGFKYCPDCGRKVRWE